MRVHPASTLSLAALAFASAPGAFAWPFGIAMRPPGATDVERAGILYHGGEYAAAAASGRPTLIMRFNDSCQHHAPPYVSAIADHGAVTTKDGAAPLCGNPNEPVTEVWYTSAKGFRGVDTVVVMPYRVNIAVTVR